MRDVAPRSGEAASDLLAQLAAFEDVRIACSFQKEASVVLDLVLPVVPHARVFTLDTGVLFPETHDTWRRFEDHFGVEIESRHRALDDAVATARVLLRFIEMLEEQGVEDWEAVQRMLRKRKPRKSRKRKAAPQSMEAA